MKSVGIAILLSILLLLCTSVYLVMIQNYSRQINLQSELGLPSCLKTETVEINRQFHISDLYVQNTCQKPQRFTVVFQRIPYTTFVSQLMLRRELKRLHTSKQPSLNNYAGRLLRNQKLKENSMKQVGIPFLLSILLLLSTSVYIITHKSNRNQINQSSRVEFPDCSKPEYEEINHSFHQFDLVLTNICQEPKRFIISYENKYAPVEPFVTKCLEKNQKDRHYDDVNSMIVLAIQQDC
ncbi:hypothetical protein ABPG73_019862 [Tetrahymena malaccensis]